MSLLLQNLSSLSSGQKVNGLTFALASCDLTAAEWVEMDDILASVSRWCIQRGWAGCRKGAGKKGGGRDEDFDVRGWAGEREWRDGSGSRGQRSAGSTVTRYLVMRTLRRHC